jgi:pimeloyl-ACP methyl ester carboxylesterase
MNLLLLPGTLCDAAVWAPIIAGIGDLAECAVGDVGAHDSLERIAEDALARHPGPLAVAGFSFGGFAALAMAAAAPERIAGLALLGTTPRPLPSEAWPERSRRLQVAERDGVAAYVAALMPAYLHPDTVGDPALEATITAMAVREGFDVLRRQVLANRVRPDRRPLLPTLRMPTMVLCGVADVICPPADHRLMAADIPGAVLTEVARAGHFVTLEQPAAVIAAMRAWLARVAKP